MDMGNGEYSPRKAMAGMKGGVCCDPFPPGAAHPDATAKTGEKGAMSDSERGVGEGISRGRGEPMAQQSPDHGPMHRSNVAFNRAGKA